MPDTQPEKAGSAGFALDPAAFDALLVDLDGVVTRTADLHAAAWKEMFDAFLKTRADREGTTFVAFDADMEYRRYVDGKPRADGIVSFLESRGIVLPQGSEADSPEGETVVALGKRKNNRFRQLLGKGVPVYPPAVQFLRTAREAGLRVAIVTSSRNGRAVVTAAGLTQEIDGLLDGEVSARLALPGKPAPDIFLEAARRLGVRPDRAVVLEDSAAGVAAGRAGAFGVVIGVDRHSDPDPLWQAGADYVVPDLAQIRIGDASAKAGDEQFTSVRERIGSRRIAVFLDYDGTLTPIVDRPDQAILSAGMRAALKALSQRCPVIVISGRGREEIAQMVGLDTLIYAGAHGFDIAGPQGMRHQPSDVQDVLPALHAAAGELQERLGAIPGILIEDKTFAVAIHYRLVPETEITAVAGTVDAVMAAHAGLRKTLGKKIFELRPDVDWDKGRAVLWLLHALDLDHEDSVPLYIGDDVTDYDAFRDLRGRGLSFLVTEEPDPGPADYRLKDTDDVRQFLMKLTEWMDRTAHE